MRRDKVWCLAIGFFLGASLIPAAKAQNQQDRRNSPGESVGGKSCPGAVGHGFLPEYYSALTDRVTCLSCHGASDQNQSGLIALRGQGEQQNWSEVHLKDGLAWNVAGPHSELDLTAADDSVREHLNLPAGQGIVVIGVAPNSSAAQAGIQQSDVLLLLGESPLGKPEDLYDRLKQGGEKPVTLTLLRAGSRKSIQVQPRIRVTLNPIVATAPAREYWIGLSVTALEPVLRAQLRLSQKHAVIVNEVFRNSPAASAAIALHDIIVAIDGKPITDANDLARSVQAKGEKPLVLEIIGKGGKSRTVAVTPERKKATETSQAARAPVNVIYSSFDFVRPGFVLDYTNAGNNPSYQWGRALLGDVRINPDSSPKSQDAGPALTQRLDALDSELKELRKLVEALQKAAATIIEQKTSSAK